MGKRQQPTNITINSDIKAPCDLVHVDKKSQLIVNISNLNTEIKKIYDRNQHFNNLINLIVNNMYNRQQPFVNNNRLNIMYIVNIASSKDSIIEMTKIEKYLLPYKKFIYTSVSDDELVETEVIRAISELTLSYIVLRHLLISANILNKGEEDIEQEYRLINQIYPDIYYIIECVFTENYFEIDRPSIKDNIKIDTNNHIWNNEIVLDTYMHNENNLDRNFYIIGAPPLSGKSTACKLDNIKNLRKDGIFAFDVDSLTFNELKKLVPKGPGGMDWEFAKRKLFIHVINRLFRFATENPNIRVVAFIHNHGDLIMSTKLWKYYVFILPSYRLVAQHKNTEPQRFKFNRLMVTSELNWCLSNNIPVYHYSKYSEINIILRQICGLIPQNIFGKNSFDVAKEYNDKILPHVIKIKMKNDHNYIDDVIIEAAHENDEILLAKVLKCKYPISNQNLYMRTRVNVHLLSRIIIFALACKLITLGDLELLFRNTNGIGGQAIACITLFMLSSDVNKQILEVLLKKGVFNHGMEYAINVLKDMHDKVRRSNVEPFSFRHIKDLDYDNLLYLHNLLGRYYNVQVGDDGSVDNRHEYVGEHTLRDAYDTRGTYTTFDKYLTKHIKNTIIDKLHDPIRKLSNISMNEIRSKLITMASVGSASTGKDQLDHLDLKSSTTKRVWLNELDDDYILKLPYLANELYTTAVLKTEPSKLRQLFPSDVNHWLKESMILYFLEKSVYRSNYRIPMEDENNISVIKFFQRIKDFDDGGIEVDIDYKDFNITHNITTLKKIYNMIGDVYKLHSGPGEFEGTNFAGYCYRLCVSLSANLDNLLGCAVGSENEYKEMYRGLWSGWRSTAFFNVTLNQIYHDMVIDAYGTMGIKFNITNDEHMGDDVRARCNNYINGISYVNAIMECKHELQNSKQLIGNYKSEFLRVSYYKDHVKGNINRSIAAFVSSDLQAPEVQDTIDFIKGTSEAMHGLIRRGFKKSTMEKLRTTILMHFAQNRSAGVKLNDSRWLYVPENEGGFGCCRYGELPVRVKHHVKHDKVQLSDNIEKEIRSIQLKSKNIGLKNIKTMLSSTLYRRGIPIDLAQSTYDTLTRNLSIEVIKSTRPEMYTEAVTSQTRQNITRLNSVTFDQADYESVLSNEFKYIASKYIEAYPQRLLHILDTKQMKFPDSENLVNIVSSTLLGEAGSLDHSLIMRVIDNLDDYGLATIMQLLEVDEIKNKNKSSQYPYIYYLKNAVPNRIIKGLLRRNIHEYNDYSGIIPSEIIHMHKYIKHRVFTLLGSMRFDPMYGTQTHQKVHFDIVQLQLQLYIHDPILNRLQL